MVVIAALSDVLGGTETTGLFAARSRLIRRIGSGAFIFGSGGGTGAATASLGLAATGPAATCPAICVDSWGCGVAAADTLCARLTSSDTSTHTSSISGSVTKLRAESSSRIQATTCRPRRLAPNNLNSSRPVVDGASPRDSISFQVSSLCEKGDTGDSSEGASDAGGAGWSMPPRYISARLNARDLKHPHSSRGEVREGVKEFV